MKNKIMNILDSFNLSNQLLILTDEETENINREAGINVDNPAYKTDEKKVAPIRPAAQCIMGEMGKYARDNYELVIPNLMKKWISQSQFDFVMSKIYGYIIVHIDECVRQLTQFKDDEVMLRKALLNLIGHELRHAHQSLEMLELQTNDLHDFMLYAMQKHELDAYAYAQALMLNRTSLEEVSTWKPSQSDLNKAEAILRMVASKLQKNAA